MILKFCETNLICVEPLSENMREEIKTDCRFQFKS